jgi:acyl carrier protein
MSAVISYLVAIKPELAGGLIDPADSLTGDLGFDSLDLVALANRIRREHPDADLRGWLAEVCDSQVDSVGGLTELLYGREPSHA